FASRSRHTSFSRDWSSDVCSSELSSDQRVNQHVAWGPGPREGQALMLAVRARALLRGRLAPAVDDVAALARPALVHRMQLSFGEIGRASCRERVLTSVDAGAAARP